MPRMVAFVLFSAALAACSALPGLGSSDKSKLAFESTPPGANVFLSPGNASCKTPCSVPAPEKSGSYNAMFILAGYIQQTVPVRVTSAKEHWYSSEVVEISPNPGDGDAQIGAWRADWKTIAASARGNRVLAASRDQQRLSVNVHRRGS